MRTLVRAALVAMSFFCSMKAHGMVFSPHVNSEHTADFRDPQRFRRFHAWKDLRGQDLALAVWRYLTDRVTGTYHFTDMWEGADPHWEIKLVQDPMKILNVYGFAVCTMHAWMTVGLYEGMGFEKGRMRGFETYHAVPEIYWDAAWHYLDIDERAYILDPQDRVASADDAATHPQWWQRSAEKVKPFYPANGGIKGIQELAKRHPAYHAYGWNSAGYTPDFVLRPGEQVERFWKGQGYWRYGPFYASAKTKKILLREPQGPKSGHSVNTYGNARFDYEPRLSRDYLDYEQGVWSDRNLRLTEAGLVLAADGKAQCTFYFQFPYVIVPDNGDLDDPDDDHDAAVVRFRSASKARLQVSTDHGLTWHVVPLRAEAGLHLADLTKYVAGGYAYWLRFEFQGRAGQVALETLKVTTWTQLAPMSLPRLRQGENHLTYELADKYGLNTWTVPITPNCSDIEQLKPYLVGKYDYDASRRNGRFKGPVTFRLAAPEGAKIEWLHISAGLATKRGKEAAATKVRFLIAADEPSDFKQVWQASVPTWTEHWYFRGEKEVRLARPARTVYVRIEPTNGMNDVRFYLHVSRPDRPAASEMAITHKFKAAGKEMSVTKRMARPGTYTVNCPAEPQNISITFAVPSKPRGER